MKWRVGVVVFVQSGQEAVVAWCIIVGLGRWSENLLAECGVRWLVKQK